MQTARSLGRPGRQVPYPPGTAAEGDQGGGAFAASSGRDNVPDVVAVVAFDVAGFLVILPVIERLALVGPLLTAVVPRDDGPVTGILGIAGNHQRRPIGGAIAIAA